MYQKGVMPSLSLNNIHLKLIMVGGKGGVGKTTCASAIALHLALTGRKVLIISSDPAPSLSDIFETDLGDIETAIPGCPHLYGLEISSESVHKRWKARFGDEIYEVVSSFADVDYDFVDYVGTAPGIEEEYMLSYIIDLVTSGSYDIVVWDTAPAGHTMRLLRLPQLFLKHMEAATKFYLNMYGYLEKMKGAVGFGKQRRPLLDIIGSWEKLSQEIIDFIRDPALTGYILVTIPEALGLRITSRIMDDFRENGLSIGHLIINHVIQEADCEFHRQRKAMQSTYLDILARTYTSIPQVRLFLLPCEVKGLDRIREVSTALFTT